MLNSVGTAGTEPTFGIMPGVNTFRAGRLDELAMHPTVKPVALIADVFKDASRRSDRVLDLFAGSGSTIIAAEKTGRQAYALEIEPHYVDVIIERWQLYTGKAALLGTTNKTFEEVAEQRKTPSGATSASDNAAASKDGAPS